MRALALAAGILAASSSSAADPWTSSELALGAGAIGALVLDWGQTRYIARHPEAWRETNGVLGAHPSTGRVDRYFAGAIAGTAIAAHLMPSTWRRQFLGAVIVVELAHVGRNYSLGIRADF